MNIPTIRRGVSALCAGAVLLGLAGSAFAAGRPSYPFPSNQPYALTTGQSRHHIIPWQELVAYGTGTYVTVEGVLQFLATYNLIDQANLGQFNGDLPGLAAAYIDEDSDDHAEAEETMTALFAWMQGNLVVGPSNRADDPGDVFDTNAYDCRQHYAAGTPEFDAYAGLQQAWNGAPDEKRHTFEMLASTAMLGNQTATNAAAVPPAPACQW